MDIATSLGLVAGFATVAVLILMGGDLKTFYDVHAVIVIFGGSLAATLIRFPLGAMLHGLTLGARHAFRTRALGPRQLVEEMTRLAELVRRQGPVALEGVEVDDALLAKGLRFVADGYERDFIRETLEKERDNFLMRLDEGQKIYRAIGDCAPAFGMIGTLIGMVQMFANMEDPSKLGPFMAIALLATLYGALLANIVCLPIADNLHVKLEEEDVSQSMIIDGVLQIRDARSPALVKELMLAYLPGHHQAEFAEAA